LALLGLAACAPRQQPLPSTSPAGAAQSAAGSQALLAAGDIAQCGSDPAERSRAAATAALVESVAGTVLAVGDLAYTKGTPQEFRDCYHPTWGRFKARTLPVPGNHEYLSDGAQPYYDYWGAQAGARAKGYYAAQVGTWRVIALNSNIDAGPDSEQARWLAQELVHNKRRCTLAFWHHPLFSSGEHGDDSRMAAIWRMLYDAGAEVVLSGHEHDYERFAPLDARGKPDAQRGVRQIIVGTGGAALRRFKAPRAHSEVRDNETFGVLKLTLRQDAYEWEFLPVAGQRFTDRGSGVCHD
jgi:hypothetical protein